MRSLADELPPDIAAAINPDWRRNEAAYWDAREALLAEYRGVWVAFADGRVVASGTSPVAVLAAAHPTIRHPFLTCVGREDEPCRCRLTDAQRAELDRRMVEDDANPDDVIPWEEVKAKAKR